MSNSWSGDTASRASPCIVISGYETKQAAPASTGQPVSGHQPHCERMRNGTAAFLNSVNEAPKIETTASFDEAAFREFQKSSSFCRACVHREIVTRRIEPIASTAWASTRDVETLDSRSALRQNGKTR